MEVRMKKMGISIFSISQLTFETLPETRVLDRLPSEFDAHIISSTRDMVLQQLKEAITDEHLCKNSPCSSSLCAACRSYHLIKETTDIMRLETNAKYIKVDIEGHKVCLSTPLPATILSGEDHYLMPMNIAKSIYRLDLMLLYLQIFRFITTIFNRSTQNTPIKTYATQFHLRCPVMIDRSRDDRIRIFYPTDLLHPSLRGNQLIDNLLSA